MDKSRGEIEESIMHMLPLAAQYEAQEERNDSKSKFQEMTLGSTHLFDLGDLLHHTVLVRVRFCLTSP